MRRWALPARLGAATLISVVLLLFVTRDSPPLLLLVAAGAPLTVLAALRATMTPEETEPTTRQLWPSLLLGATVVPAIVLAAHGIFLAIGYGLVEPLVEPARELLDGLRADRTLLDLLTTGWTFLLIVELAVVAPLAEETTKPLAALVRRPRTARDAFLFGAAAGTGFAIVENMLYAGGWYLWFGGYWVQVSVMRMLGSGLHAFGAALMAWAWFQWRRREPHCGRRLAGAAFLAFTGHGLWNGAIAVTHVLYEGRREFITALYGDAAAWGTVLMIFLASLGAVLVGALLWAGRRVAAGHDPLAVSSAIDLSRPATIGAWAMVTTSVLVPATIMALVFPAMISL